VDPPVPGVQFESVDVRPLALTNFSLVSSQFLISEIASCTTAVCDTTISAGTVCTRPSLSKLFAPSTALLAAGSTLVYTVTNGTDSPKQDSIAFTDKLPDNLVVATSPNIQTNCPAGGSFSSPSFSVGAAAGATSISVQGLSIGNGVASCDVQVNVSSTMPGDYSSGPGSLSGIANVDNSAILATLTLQP
jgi:hypothetical protein